MLETIVEYFYWVIGEEREFERLPAIQVAARTVVIYGVALLLIRLGKRRFMGNYSAIDILLGFIVGSAMARAATGAISLLDMVTVVGVLLAVHWVLATVGYYWKDFDKAIEKEQRELIIDGKIQEKAMFESKITERELDQALRKQGGVRTAEEVRVATLEIDGTITVVPKDRREPSEDDS